MLQRLALAATLDQFAECGQFRVGQRALEIQVEFHARKLEDVRQQQLCLQARRVHPALREKRRAFLNDLKHRHARSVGGRRKVQRENSRARCFRTLVNELRSDFCC